MFTFIIKATFTGQWLFQGSHFSKPTKMIFFQDFSKFFQQMSRHFSLLLKWLPSSFELKSVTLKNFIWAKIDLFYIPLNKRSISRLFQHIPFSSIFIKSDKIPVFFQIFMATLTFQGFPEWEGTLANVSPSKYWH